MRPREDQAGPMPQSLLSWTGFLTTESLENLEYRVSGAFASTPQCLDPETLKKGTLQDSCCGSQPWLALLHAFISPQVRHFDFPPMTLA